MASEPGISIETDIKWVFPDSYIRTDKTHFSDGVVSYISGFDGDRLLNRTVTSSPHQHFGDSWGPEQLPVERRESALLLVGLLGWATNGVTLHNQTLHRESGGLSEIGARVGDRDVMLKLDSQCLPVAMTYRASVHIPQPGAKSIIPAATMSDVVVSYEDRRSIQGFSVPFRLSESANGVMLERLTIKEYKVQPRRGAFRNRS